MDSKCKVVVDLLPTYIEKLTSDETNKFIEEHLKSCKDCKKIYSDMASELEKENIENTEIIKKIKSYKRKTLTIKLAILIVMIVILFPVVKTICFKYYVVRNVLKKNIDYDLGDNYTIEEYDDSIERYENHISTYYLEGKMKKVYGDKVLEYYDGKDHYYFDNDAKTYYVEKDVELNDNLNINIKIFKNKNFNNNPIEILKFIMSKDITIKKQGFRDEEFYYIYEKGGGQIYFDKDTFIAERIVNDKKDSNNKKYTEINRKEYRITQSDVNYRLVTAPNFSLYTLIEKGE